MTPTEIAEATKAAPQAKVVEPPPPASAPKFQLVSIGDLYESTTNPRKFFDAIKLKEVAETMKETGVLQPLVVRTTPKGFEIVAGARRYRAAKIAGLKQVPAMVHTFGDLKALEVQIIENLHREEISAMETAFGYRQLLDHGYTMEQLAERLEKSVRHVYAILQLQKLHPKVREALERGDIKPGHAERIGTIERPEDQVTTLEACFVEEYDDHRDLVVAPKESLSRKGLISIRELDKIVTAIKLGGDLVKKVEEIRKSGSRAYLISTKSFGRSRQALSPYNWHRQGAKKCNYAAKGVLVDGSKRGAVIDICVSKDSCKKHFAARSSSGSTSSDAYQRKWELQRIREDVDREARVGSVTEMLTDFIKKTPGPLTKPELILVAREILQHGNPEALNGIYRWGGSRTVPVSKFKSMSEANLHQLIRAALWSNAADRYPSGAITFKTLEAAAKAKKVDVKAIVKRHQDAANAKYNAKKGSTTK